MENCVSTAATIYTPKQCHFFGSITSTIFAVQLVRYQLQAHIYTGRLERVKDGT